MNTLEMGLVKTWAHGVVLPGGSAQACSGGTLIGYGGREGDHVMILYREAGALVAVRPFEVTDEEYVLSGELLGNCEDITHKRYHVCVLKYEASVENEEVIQRMGEITQKFLAFRRVKRDRHCWVRALMVGLLEFYCRPNSDLNGFREVVKEPRLKRLLKRLKRLKRDNPTSGIIEVNRWFADTVIESLFREHFEELSGGFTLSKLSLKFNVKVHCHLLNLKGKLNSHTYGSTAPLTEIHLFCNPYSVNILYSYEDIFIDEYDIVLNMFRAETTNKNNFLRDCESAEILSMPEYNDALIQLINLQLSLFEQGYGQLEMPWFKDFLNRLKEEMNNVKLYDRPVPKWIIEQEDGGISTINNVLSVLNSKCCHNECASTQWTIRLHCTHTFCTMHFIEELEKQAQGRVLELNPSANLKCPSCSEHIEEKALFSLLRKDMIPFIEAFISLNRDPTNSASSNELDGTQMSSIFRRLTQAEGADRVLNG